MNYSDVHIGHVYGSAVYMYIMSPERAKKIIDAISTIKSQDMIPTVRNVHAIVFGSRDEISAMLRSLRPPKERGHSGLTRSQKIADAKSLLEAKGEKVTVRSIHAIVRGRLDSISAVLRVLPKGPPGTAQQPGMAVNPSGSANTPPIGRPVHRRSGSARCGYGRTIRQSGVTDSQTVDLPVILTLEKTASLLRSLSALGVAAQRSCARLPLARDLTQLCIHYRADSTD